MDWLKNVNLRENYLYFADNYYSSARTLIVTGGGLGAIVLAALAVEQYIKLKLYESGFTESDIEKVKHNLCDLFKMLEQPMKLNSLSLKPFDYYKDILTRLYEGFQYKYYDSKGVLKALEKHHGSVYLGLSRFDLEILDELCFELRSALSILASGYIEELINQDNNSTQSMNFRINNKQLGNFNKTAKDKYAQLIQ